MRTRQTVATWHAAGFLLTTLLVMTAPAQTFQDLLGGKPKGAPAQPAQIDVRLERGSKAGTVDLTLEVKTPAEAWVYAIKPASGPDTSVRFKELVGVQQTEPRFLPDRDPKIENVAVFAVNGDSGDVEKFVGGVTWKQSFTVLPGADVVRILGQIKYQVCDESNCKFGTAPIDVTLNLESTPGPNRADAPVALQTNTVGGESAAWIPDAGDDQHQFRQFTSRRSDAVPISTWRVAVDKARVLPGDLIQLAVQVELADEWHIYAFNQEQNADGEGPGRTVIDLTDLGGLSAVDPQFFGAPPHEVNSTAWEGLVERTWEGRQTFVRTLRVPADAQPGEVTLRGLAAWQACKGSCLISGFRFELPVTVVAGPQAPAAEPLLAQIAGLKPTEANAAIDSAPLVAFAARPSTRDPDAPRPVPAGVGQPAPAPRDLPDAPAQRGPMAPAPAAEVSGAPAVRSASAYDKSQGLPLFLLVAAVSGFASLLTPCVFPMVPITVSFFQKQSERDGHRPVTMALVYCFGIIATFTLLGLLMTIAFGATALNALANNPWLNLFIAGVMIFFGMNLLGLFEITMPGWLLNYTAGQESRGGYIGVLFMALTFTLTSFTCTFAFVGGLLGAAAGGDRLWPLLGLLVFSAAFSLPFFFLALFPSWLKKLPRAGGWMNTIKVVMGLVELGAAFKFLSVADLSWNPTPAIFDYELVMSAWMVISISTALYLLGLFRLPHDVQSDHIGVMRFFSAMSFLGLAAYIGVGLYGAEKPTSRVWEFVAAFAPPKFEGGTRESDFGPALQHGDVLYALDYQKALEYARKKGKPVFLEFTGVNCQNCRLMENGPLSSREVRAKLKEYVCVQVWCDRVPVLTDEPERARLLDQNLELQAEWYGDTSLPAYVLIRPDTPVDARGSREGILGEKIGYSPSVTAALFAQFLEDGLKQWQRSNTGKLVGQAD